LCNTNPKLGPLTSNGGPTQTHALLPGSPVIDQRGVARIGKCDIGAYEFVERIYLSLMFRNYSERDPLAGMKLSNRPGQYSSGG
jgi:hypothetical protein